MKTHSFSSKNGGLLSLALGPLLLLCIAMATVNMMKTYKQIHQQKQATLWGLVQLDRHIGQTVLSTQQFVDEQITVEQLQQSYRTLQHTFPDTTGNIHNDRIFQQIIGLSDSVNNTYQHVQKASVWMANPSLADRSRISRWLNQLDAMNQTIGQEVLDNVASTQAEYAEKAFGTIVSRALILLAVIVVFIGYLSYLLWALRKERKRNLYMLAHDPLTELSSRDCIMTSLQSRCNNQTAFALLMFDLNKFKAVNDTFGHHAGDQLLIHLATMFKRSLCQFGIVGRMGGDEFIWIAESDNPAIIEQQFVLFRKELETPCMIQGKPIHLQISTGGGIAADYQFQITELLERVDQAMYVAKAEQLNTIAWDKDVREHISQEVLRRSAIDKDALNSRASKALHARKTFPA